MTVCYTRYMIKLIPDTIDVLKHAWSVRLMIAAIAVLWLERPLTALIESVAGYSLLSQLIGQAVTSTVMVLAIFARVVVQARLNDTKREPDHDE